MSKKKEPLIPPLPDGVDAEDALRAFMQVDPEKVKEAEQEAQKAKDGPESNEEDEDV